MSGMNEINQATFDMLTTGAGTAITAELAAGTASVFKWRATPGAAMPFVVYMPSAPSTPSHTFGGVSYEDTAITVKAVTDGNAAQAGTIAGLIDSALADRAGTVSGHNLMSLRRLTDVDYVEDDPGGGLIYHRGGTYRLMAEPT